MKPKSEIAVLLLGSNLGDRVSLINHAVELISKNCGKVSRCSSFYESSPWGFLEQPNYINQCVLLETGLQPIELLNELKKIENTLGRTAAGKWQARIIDIDILFFGSRVIEETNLTIPHPMMAARNFALIPLQEMLPRMIHPVLNKTISELLSACSDTCDVKIYTPSEVLHA